jgi:hypothetical protein
MQAGDGFPVGHDARSALGARSQQQRINTSLGVMGSRDEKRLPMLDEPRLLGPPSTRTWPFLLKVPLASKP